MCHVALVLVKKKKKRSYMAKGGVINEKALSVAGPYGALGCFFGSILHEHSPARGSGAARRNARPAAGRAGS
jgi:hypothetical protein